MLSMLVRYHYHRGCYYRHNLSISSGYPLLLLLLLDQRKVPITTGPLNSPKVCLLIKNNVTKKRKEEAIPIRCRLPISHLLGKLFLPNVCPAPKPPKAPAFHPW